MPNNVSDALPDPSPDEQNHKARCDRKSTKVQASEIQAFLHEHIMKLKEKVDADERLGEDVRDEANALSNLVRAWDTAADRARIARGKPLPGSNRPVRAPRRKAGVAGNDPTETPQPCVVSPPPAPSQTPQGGSVTDNGTQPI